MSLSHRLLWCAVVAAAAWGAYAARAMPLVSIALAVLCVGSATVAWRLGRKRPGADMFRDLSVSTLVFPPESRRERSAARARGAAAPASKNPH